MTGYTNGFLDYITIAIRAWSLHGDVVGLTEGYVKVWSGDSYRRSRYITSNSPQWNAYFDFGNVDTGDRLRLQMCGMMMTAWEGVTLTRIKESTSIAVKWNLVASHFHTNSRDSHLTGSKCYQYTTSLGKEN